MRKHLMSWDVPVFGGVTCALYLKGGPTKHRMESPFVFEASCENPQVSCDAMDPNEARKHLETELHERCVKSWTKILHVTVSVPGSHDRVRRLGVYHTRRSSLRLSQDGAASDDAALVGRHASLCIEYQVIERGVTDQGHEVFRALNGSRIQKPLCGYFKDANKLFEHEQNLGNRVEAILDATPENQIRLNEIIEALESMSTRVIHEFGSGLLRGVLLPNLAITGQEAQ